MSEYLPTETIYEGATADLYRAVRCADGQPVVMKVLRAAHPTSLELGRLRQDYEIGRLVAGPHAIQPLGLELHHGRPALILETFAGRSLDGLLAGSPLPTGRFLRLAVRMAAGVADLHQHGVIHRDVKPSNFLVNPETDEIRITDFGIASLLPREHQAVQSPGLIEGSLAYMSPEQTGRMNRAIDSRTDLYSLGVTFYQMLTGALPFQAGDPLEWIHCHIARTPQPPQEIVPPIPRPVGDVVMRLLAKAAEDRYQSARGLEHDLRICLERWEATGDVGAFPLGERDVPDRFQIPQRLYGREAEIAALQRALQAVVTQGQPELVLVSGYSGIGKSSLVNELRRPVVQERGFFLAGKFDQYKRDIPYSTIVEAFRDLVVEVLSGSAERVAAFRQRLRGALGLNGQLIVDVIPQVGLILGPQPPVPELPLSEAQSRFNMVFRQFIGVFARPEHPLTLFLDDLQWADSASLRLLQDVITHLDTRHLLLVGAYRDNEVDPAHPLMLTLERVRGAGAVVRSLVLAPLSTTDLSRLIADTVRCTPAEALPLSTLVHEKTGGNPFFAIQFLDTLQKERLIEFDHQAAAWRWDIEQIRVKDITDNVADLMLGRLRRLPAATQDAVRLAACVGNHFDVQTLALVADRAPQEVRDDLREAVREGLLLQLGAACKFLHDRVQQAAYSLIPEAERASVHLRIGRLLLDRTPAERREERIFDIVNQLNLGAGRIPTQPERDEVARLNLLAGRKAKAAAAFQSASDYLGAGIDLLGGQGWERCYELAFTLHFERAQCAYVTSSFAEAERLVALLLARARSKVDRAAAYRLRGDLYLIQGAIRPAIDSAIEALQMFDIALSAHPSREQVLTEFNRVFANLADRRIEELIDLPAMSDPDVRAAMDILSAVMPPAFFTDNNLIFLVLCHMVNLSLVHGNTDGSTMGYVHFGMILGPEFGRYEEGYRFGRLALDLVEKHGLVAYQAKIYLFFGNIINFWTQPLRTDLDYLHAGYQAALETGDLSFACYCGNHLLAVQLALGENLEEVERESERRLEVARRAKFDEVCDIIISIQRFVRALRGLTASLSTFSDERFTEEAFEEHIGRQRLPITVCWYYILKLQARLLAGDPRAALAASRQARARLWATLAHLQVPEYHFYTGLSLAAACDQASPAEREELLAHLRDHRAPFEAWAATCPQNFAHKLTLLSAEVARLEGRGLEALRLYEQAIRSAREEGFVHIEAMAHELAARLCQRQGLDTVATAYLREARAGYLRWGAAAKVRQIDQLHPELRERRPLAPTVTFAVGTEHLDLLSVIKASQSISREILLPRLQQALMRILAEHAGARHGYLLLVEDGALTLQVEARTRGCLIEAQAVAGSPSPALLPLSIVSYVLRAGEPVLLDDASREPRFSSDEYVAAQQPRSVLCLPILWRGEVRALVYLENSLVSGAFGRDHLSILELLASQAAISFETARLYREAQEAIAARDGFISIASHELRTPLTPLRLHLESLARLRLQGPHAEAVLARKLAVALRQVDRLTRLVQDLLETSRINAGRLALSPEETDLCALVRESAAHFAEQIALAGSQLELQLDGAVIGRWDPLAIEQVVVNLLSNAVKFGCGRPIHVAAWAEAGTAVLSVRDHGIGISPASQQRIFERFERAVSMNAYGGLGLGLFIAREIVLAHGGMIQVASEPGQGATFTVRLPRS